MRWSLAPPPNSDFALSSTGKADITASVEQSKTEFTYADGVRIGQSVKATGTVTAHDMTAGKWHGQYQFNVNLSREITKSWDISVSQDGSLTMDYYATTKTAVIHGNGVMAPALPLICLSGATEQMIQEIFMFVADSSKVPSMETLQFLAEHTEDGSGNIMDDTVGLILDYNINNLVIENGCQNISDMAFSRTSVKNVSIPNSVTSIGNSAFDNCDSLTSITIPNSVTSIGNSAFDNCDSLTNVIIGDGVTTIEDYAFFYCDNLTNVTIGNGVTTIGKQAFYCCDSLTNVTIPNSVTTIEEQAFSSCYSLTNVTIGDGVTTIGKLAFYNCDSLTNVTIPNSVTTIEEQAFSYCDNLTITIGNGVTTIGEQAFYYCDSLTNVTIPNSVTTIGERAFDQVNNNAVIYCQSQAMADLVTQSVTNATIIVDASKF